jgi:hypothetical protein
MPKHQRTHPSRSQHKQCSGPQSQHRAHKKEVDLEDSLGHQLVVIGALRWQCLLFRHLDLAYCYNAGSQICCLWLTEDVNKQLRIILNVTAITQTTEHWTSFLADNLLRAHSRIRSAYTAAIMNWMGQMALVTMCAACGNPYNLQLSHFSSVEELHSVLRDAEQVVSDANLKLSSLYTVTAIVLLSALGSRRCQILETRASEISERGYVGYRGNKSCLKLQWRSSCCYSLPDL